MPFFDCTMLGGLSAMGFDVAEVQFGLPDDRVLREGVQARDVGDVLRAEFTGQDASALQLVLPRLDGDVTPYALSLSRLEGVARVATTDGVYAGGAQVPPAAAAIGASGSDATGAWLTVVPSLDTNSPAAEKLVRQARDLDPPGQMLVTGESAFLVDGKNSISSRLWIAALLIAVSTFILLFLFTGSVVLPIKALLLNLLSLGAVLGVMTWIFQDGHLSGLLDFTPTPSRPQCRSCCSAWLSVSPWTTRSSGSHASRRSTTPAPTRARP